MNCEKEQLDNLKENMDGRSPFTVILVLLLFSSVCVRGHEVVSLTTHEVDGVLRVDIDTKNPLHHFTVMHVYACSSVDLEMQTYDTSKSTITGCRTPGFIARKIYGSDKTPDPAFHAHVKSRSIMLTESVVDSRTPVVYIQVEMRITDEDGLLMSPSTKSSPGDPFVLVTRYTQPEKRSGPQEVTLDGPVASPSAPKEMPWYFFTMGGIGLAVACVVVGVIKSRWKTGRFKRRTRGYVSGYDMETGKSFGSGSDFVKAKRATHVRWAMLQGWWKE